MSVWKVGKILKLCSEKVIVGVAIVWSCGCDNHVEGNGKFEIVGFDNHAGWASRFLVISRDFYCISRETKFS